MASKRKSTTPCMIPTKVIRPIEELERDSSGFFRQSRLSGGDAHRPLDPGESSRLEPGDADKDGAGTYTCKPCNFETHDLNLFLDHVYTGHPEFRADPSFLCTNCGVSALKFEGLALHNARVHPSSLNTILQLRKRDRRMVVEQSLVNVAESGKESEISITKTPIMRRLKGKSEPKRIVVSHPGSDEPSADPAPKGAERKETAVTVTHVPTIVHNGTTKVTLPSAIQIVNGSAALPILKTPITQVVSVAQTRSIPHAAPISASSNVSSASSLSSSKNLPKVMIPLSSIPTYSASMDDSSFLKTSFSKFPYPTKAELCYLTVVTKFPEEQIKIWFTAQRLKQGISWSPEEIEEARRKMFNTIIQTAPAASQNQNQSQSQHGSAQHTITVLPASLGAAGIPQFLQGSLVGQGGVIVTQPVVANGIQVSSAPVALAVTPKPQAAARPMMQARPAAALVADKGISMVVGTVGSSSSAGSSIIVSSKSGGGGGGGVINLSLGNISNVKVSSVGGKPGSANADSSDKSSSNATSHASGGSNPGAASDNNEQKSKDASSSTNNASTDDDEPSPAGSPGAKMEDPSSPASKSSSPSPSGAPGTSQTAVNAFLDPIFCKGKKSPGQLSTLKESFQMNQFPDQEEVERLVSLTSLTVREVRKWFSDRRYHFRHHKSLRSTTGGQNKSSPASGAGSGASTPGSTASGDNLTPVDLSEGSSNCGSKTPQHSSPTAPVNPAGTQTPTSPTTPSRRLHRAQSPDFTAIRYKEREPHQVRALETSFTQNAEPSGEEVDRLRTETKMTRREIHSWFAERRKRVAAEKKREEAERALKDDEEEMEVDGEERQRDDGSGELKVNPIKINLKMLKVTEASGKSESEGPDHPTVLLLSSSAPLLSTSAASPVLSKAIQSSTPTQKTSYSPKPTTVRGKKTVEQLHLLKQVYSRTQWPSATQYDELLTGTGLPRSEVVRWFGDCRYVQKNGQLKWLEEYQNLALEEDLQKEKEKVLQAQLDVRGRPEESQLSELAESSGLTTDLVRFWFSTKMKAAAAYGPSSDPLGSGVAEEPPSTGSCPPEPLELDCIVAAQAKEATTAKILNTAKEID